jgi:hypothetical protein
LGQDSGMGKSLEFINDRIGQRTILRNFLLENSLIFGYLLLSWRTEVPKRSDLCQIDFEFTLPCSCLETKSLNRKKKD